MGVVFKSTYCASLYQHCETVRRTAHIVNLDPATESFDYPVAMDIKELISLDDVMEELGLGPNGSFIYCMEHLEESLDDWLTEELDNFADDDYIVFDCPVVYEEKPTSMHTPRRFLQTHINTEFAFDSS